MATARDTLEVVATLRDQISTPIRTIQRNITSFARRIGRGFLAIGRAVTSFRGILLGLGGALAVRGLTRFISATAEGVDQVGKFAQQIGVSTEFLSTMGFVAERAGLRFNTVAVALQRLTRRATEFRTTGGGVAADAFRILGEEIETAVRRGESMEELLPKLAVAFSQVEDEQQKVLLAFKLFDTEGVRLLRFLNEEYSELVDNAREFGAVISREQAAAAARFEDQVTNITTAFNSLRRAAVAEALPAINDLLENLLGFIRENREEIQDFIREFVFGFLELPLRGIKIIQQVRLASKRVGQLLLEDFEKTNITGVVSERVRRGRQEIETLEEQIKTINTLLERMEERAAQARFPVPGDVDFVGPVQQFERAVKEATAPSIEQDIQELADAFDALNSSVGATGTTMDGLLAGLEEVRVRGTDAMANTRDAVLSVADSITDNLSEAIVQLGENWNNAGEIFRNFARSMLQDLSRLIARMAVFRLVGTVFGAIGGQLFPGARQFPTEAVETPGIFQPGAGFTSPTVLQRGGLVLGSRPVPAVLHPPEAVVPLGRGGFPGLSDGQAQTVNIFNVTAMDSRDVSRFFREGLAANRDLLSTTVAERFQAVPGIRSRFG